MCVEMISSAENIAKKGGRVIIASRSLERSERAADMIKVLLAYFFRLQTLASTHLLKRSQFSNPSAGLIKCEALCCLQNTGARGEVEAMHLDLTSFK